MRKLTLRNLHRSSTLSRFKKRVPDKHVRSNRESLAGKLQDADLVGDIQGVILRKKLDISFLQPIGSDECVDSCGPDVVHFLDGILNLLLVCLGIGKHAGIPAEFI